MNYSFYEFSKNLLTGCGNVPLPVMYASDVAFYHQEPINSVSVCSVEGGVIKSNISGYYSTQRKHFKMSEELGFVLAVNTCFRFRIETSTGFYYSNILVFAECIADDCSSSLSYSCNESQFGFDYLGNDNRYNSVRLPLRLVKKQYPQTQKLYVKATGKRVVLTSTIGFEWELETDYIPEPWHEKLVVALSHDDVLINGIRVTQEGGYSVLWDSVIDNECGVKLVRGSTKVRGDSEMRNSNC